MKYGICLNVIEESQKGTLAEHLEVIVKSGYDYVEGSVVPLQDATDQDIEQVRTLLTRFDIPCLRANCFFPGDAVLVGPEFDPAPVQAYLDCVIPKAARLGIQTIVFGSGGARRVPKGFDFDAARTQFIDCARMAAQTAAPYGIRIALEHLNPKETNLLTTIEEAAQTAQLAAEENCGFLMDYYHVDLSTDDLSQVTKNAGRLFHVHVALPGSREYPFLEDADVMKPFFQVLASAGYDGTVSLEGSMRKDLSYEENLHRSMALFHAALASTQI